YAHSGRTRRPQERRQHPDRAPGPSNVYRAVKQAHAQPRRITCTRSRPPRRITRRPHPRTTRPLLAQPRTNGAGMTVVTAQMGLTARDNLTWIADQWPRLRAALDP